jgi:two-component system sensor histidine kinase MprB
VSLRTRITMIIALVVAAAVAAVCTASYVSTRGEAYGEIDQFLVQRVALVTLAAQPPDMGAIDPRSAPVLTGWIPVRGDASFRVVTDAGEVVFSYDNLQLPLNQLDVAIAAGTADTTIRDVRTGTAHYRMITAPLGSHLAVQIARNLAETDAFLGGLRIRLLLIAASAVALAALVVWLVSHRFLAPVRRLTDAAEHVAATRDLATPIAVDRTDEIGRLAISFNTMLAALASSQRQQQRLVADAGHELRTPLTSLRTNIELLARAQAMDPADRADLLADATHELEELSALVGELVDLASDSAPDEEMTEVRLDEIAARAVERARRRTGREILLDSDPVVLTGRPGRLERAITNLLDNAHKWSPPEAPIEVAVRSGRVSVRDHGPGIGDEDLPRVFDRFYRSTGARTTPGSGLGLAIVKQIAEEHAFEVFAGHAQGGGAVVGFGTAPGA